MPSPGLFQQPLAFVCLGLGQSRSSQHKPVGWGEGQRWPRDEPLGAEGRHGTGVAGVSWGLLCGLAHPAPASHDIH